MGNSNQYELTEEVLKHFTLHSYVLDISVCYVDQVYTRKKWYKKVFLFMEDGNPTVRISQFSGDSVWKKYHNCVGGFDLLNHMILLRY